jgi:hypothetical protein
MIKSLAAFAILLLLAASVMALPSFAPVGKASEAVVLPRADRLEFRAVSRNCAKQVWPDFATACLRTSNSEAKLVEARLVTAQR